MLRLVNLNKQSPFNGEVLPKNLTVTTLLLGGSYLEDDMKNICMTDTLAYKSWYTMKQRCFNHNAINFSYYGGRGITICLRWLTFKNFYSDMGERPSISHSIERINNNGNYEPSNCRWATKAEQSINKNMYKSNRSGFRGIMWCRASRKWLVRTSINGKRKHIGRYFCLKKAVDAYKNYRRFK